jgi:Ca2+-binding RTX toxin-like protein
MFRKLVVLGLGVLSAATVMEVVQPSDGLAAVRCDGFRATLVGTAGPDILQGTARRDVIMSLGGDDRVRGRGGDDIICGGRGTDDLDGDRGMDRLFGGRDDDRLFGGTGKDVLGMSRGNDFLGGGRGNDLLRVLLFGSAPNTRFVIDLAAGKASSVFGLDRLNQIEDLRLVRGGPIKVVGNSLPNDIVIFGGANFAPGALVRGRGGNDRIHTDLPNDTVFGGSGDDVIATGFGDDVLDGGPGTDALHGGPDTDTCTNGEMLFACP